jgi:endo-1,4-beta-xylanase
MKRRTFLRTAAGATALLTVTPAWSAESKSRSQSAKNQPPDAEILAQAKARIEQYRKGDGVISVRDAQGKAIPGVAVKLEQTRHDFLFGCNFFMFGRLREAQLEQEYRRRFAALLNYATLGFYWPSYEPQRGQPQYDYTDKVLDWCKDHSITCKGHPLVWDYADPRWLPHEFKEIRQLSHDRVRDCVARFKGRLNIWDVVNEPTHLGRFKTRMGEWAISLGAVPYVKEHLKIARAANPQAKLLVNDYRTDPPYYKILDALREDGKPLFDTIGIQSHMHHGVWPLARIWQVCDTFEKLSTPIHFTETTIVSGPFLGRDPKRRTNAFADEEKWGESTAELEARQAGQVEMFYTTVFAHPAVRGLTWWDFSDAGAWKRAAAGWLRKDMSPKPAYDRLMTLIKREWWTKTEGRTDGQGCFVVRAFYGEHRATARCPDGKEISKEVSWERGKTNRVELAAE